MADHKSCWSFVGYLQTNPRAIKFQVMLFVFFSHIHYPFKKYYERFQGASPQAHEPNHPATCDCKWKVAARERKTRWATLGLWWRLREGRHKPNAFASAPDAHQWDWRRVPRKLCLRDFYDTLSLVWMLWVVFRTLFGVYLFALLDRLVGDRIGLPGRCLFMGRFVLHPTLEHEAAVAFSLFHLIWRAVQRFSGRSYMLGPFIFLLQSEHDLKRFLGLMEENRSGHYLHHSRAPVPVKLPTSWPETEFMSRRLRWVPPSERLQGEARLRGQAQDRGDGGDDDKQEAGVHERFLRHLMCYEVHSERGAHFRLRPNRTLEARKLLAVKLAKSYLVSLASYMSLALPITSIIVLILLSDYRYVQIYPGCSPELDRLFAQNKLTSWSITMNRHHLLSFFFDLTENVIIWMDSGLALTFVVMLTYFINSDLLLYWSHLQLRLESTAMEIRAPLLLEHGARQSSASAAADQARLSALINEIQFELSDFFRQVERADLIVSDILTASILIWLVSFAGASYYRFAGIIEEVPLIIKMVQLFGLFVLTMATKYLLTLNKCCLRSYKLICTLMAYEQAHQTKRQFIKVLEFYSKRNRTTYTLFQRYPYLATTYITIMGWSFSCLAIASALFGRDRNEARASAVTRHKYFSF